MLSGRNEKHKMKGHRMICFYCKKAIPQNHDNWMSAPTPNGGKIYAHNRCQKKRVKERKKKELEAKNVEQGKS